MPQDPKGDKNRLQFKQLIAANPNYFAEQVKGDAKKKGTLDAPGPPTGNMTYEQLTCVGFQPDLNLLEATVQIKLSSGYLTELCDAGSTEYVRFFIDYGAGAGWQDIGYAAFNIHDLPDFKDCAKNPDKPISFVVTHPLDPKRDYCKRPVLPLVRAILSWEAIPTGPNYPVVWGNGLDRHIQIKRRDWKIIDIMTELSAVSTVKLKLPPQLEAVKLNPIPIPDPPDPELGELVQLYGMKQGTKPGGAPKTSVEPHRFGMADIQSTLAPGAFTQQAIVSKIDKWKGLGLDWPAAIAALDKTSGNTTYEQLDCLGLDYNVERLVATFRIKLNGGYSGGPCDNGSKEHIAFWADWDNTCKWTYLDTVSIVVHDFDPIPTDGLNYSAVLKVNLDKYRRSCKEPKIGRVRAVLSWNTLPSTTDPDALPPWGNRVDSHVQIRPGVPAEGPLLDGIGGIGVHDIDIAIGGMTKTGARFSLTGSFADPWDSTRSCPFGGLIVIQGAPFGTPGSTRYRVLARQVGIAMVPLRITNDIWTVPQGGGAGMWRSADADDAFTYLSAANNYEEVLAYWTPSGDELWEIRVQVIDGGGAEIAGTAWHKVQLDNTRPVAELTIDGGACDKYTPGTVINGHFVARDLHFGAFGLEILPASLWPPNPNSALPSTPWPGTSQTPVSPGATWTVNTTGMAPCGYVVRLVVYDRTVVGSSPGSHNAWSDDKGFCLLEKL